MNKKWLIPIILLLFSIASFLFLQKNTPALNQQSKLVQTSIPNSTSIPVVSQDADLIPLIMGSKQFTVERVDNQEEQAKGLSGRDSIGSDGMLFIFPSSSIAKFWMIDMQFDLDFIWINDGKVVEITPNVPKPEPGMLSSELPTYQPSVPVNAMLEVNAGFAAQQGIQVGDVVKY